MTTTELTRPHRCAIYFAPTAGTEWARRGDVWLGREAAHNLPLRQPGLTGITPALLESVTTHPRRYGWHATLKAPFQIAQGHDLGDVCAATRALASRFKPFTLPALAVSDQDGFLALRPVQPCEELDAISAACVTQLHHLAAPLSAADLERRRRSDLDPEADALMLRWGYPWVLHRFEFHLSLTGPLDAVPATTRDVLQRQAQAWFAGLPACRFESLTVFVQPEPDAPFQWVDQCGLGA